jgi:hypothetical protein
VRRKTICRRFSSTCKTGSWEKPSTKAGTNSVPFFSLEKRFFKLDLKYGKITLYKTLSSRTRTKAFNLSKGQIHMDEEDDKTILKIIVKK